MKLVTQTDANGYYSFGQLLLDENYLGTNPGSPTLEGKCKNGATADRCYALRVNFATPSTDTGRLSMLSPHLRSTDSISTQNTIRAPKAMKAQV